MDIREREILRTERKATKAKFLRSTPYGSLELSMILDALNNENHAEHSQVREVIDPLIERGATRGAIAIFNRHFGGRTVSLRLAVDRTGKIPHHRLHITPAMPLSVEFVLWTLLLSSDMTRIRRCAECRTYFFDRTRNGKKQYCTSRCASRVTSRDYRAAGKEREARARRRVTTNRQNSLRS